MNQRMSLATFIILALVIATLGTQMLVTNNQLRREQAEIARQYEQQTPQIESARQLRTQFDGIAGAVAQLAEQGNPNAIRVKEQLAAQGVNLQALPQGKPETVAPTQD